MVVAGQIPRSFKVQYLMNEVKDQVDFFYADKHERFPQIGTSIFDGHDKIYHIVSQVVKFLEKGFYGVFRV